MTAAVRRGGGYPIVSEGVPEIAEWHRVAKFNLRLLCGEFLPPATGVKTSRLDLLERCGYISGGKLDKERLGNDLLHRFGVEYLSVFTPIHGFVSSLQRAVLLDENRVGAPFFAMLVCYLLNHIAERFASSEDPNCPASRSCHDESHRVIQWGNGERGHHYLCACGLSFIILDDDGSGARIHPTQEGQDVALAIKILSERSYSVPRLVRMLGISQDIILKMLNGSVAILPWSRRTERAKYLAKWIDLISRCGDADAAYVARPQLYHALGKLLDVLPDILTPRDTAVSTRKRLVRGER
ncbi:hypothetical protein [Paraburkholderia caribensis]|uniref:hypothetical protein n=1 Tax=Paraburkholderia caribensis TaxID=75105 RepID=UPI0034D1EC18